MHGCESKGIKKVVLLNSAKNSCSDTQGKWSVPWEYLP